MSSEKFEGNSVSKADVDNLSEAELAELGETYKVGGQANGVGAKAAFGAMVLGAALAASPDDASAQSRERISDTTKVSNAESERRVVSEGVAKYPELGDLKVEILYKKIDVKNPYGYSVLINGEEQKVDFAQFLRNGSGVVEFKFLDGAKGTILLKLGAVPTLTKEGGPAVPIE